MKAVVNVLMVFFSTTLWAQKYDVAAIPDSLLNHARVIKRNEEIILEIKSPAKVISSKHYVYTILNESADNYANFTSIYDKFTTIDNLSGTLYNETGRELKHVKKKDMQDLAYSDDATLINDERYRKNNFYCRNYPYTVEYEEVHTKNGVLSFSDWFPVETIDMSVQYSRYIIIAPIGYEVRYKQFNFSIPPLITQKGEKKIYTWEIKNMAAHAPEPLAPPKHEVLPYMMIAPSDFEAEGYKGSLKSWESFGKFIYQLSKDRDVLPADITSLVHQLTDDLKDPKQKISVLYDLLQKNTHYISIQLGIGGLQPFDAAFVATKKYGDCKALSNYMLALLKEVKISAKYVVIRASENARQIVTDFPDFQFDHVICCVPLQNDTVWLECTSSSLPPGYLSGFTANRWGLLVDETGGKLVHTPKYGVKDNLQIRNIKATINNEGNLSASIVTQYQAMQQDELEGVVNAYSNDKVMDYLKNTIDLPTFDIKSFDYTQHKDLLPYINESLVLTAGNFAQVTGKRLFVNPNILTRSNQKLPVDENRKYDVVLNNEYHEIDTVEIAIPPGYDRESFFNDINIETKFGKYKAAVKLNGENLIYIRSREHYSGRFEPGDYTRLVNYFDKVYKADHTKIVFTKKE